MLKNSYILCRLLQAKKKELGDARDKLRNGLSKIDDTRQKVEKMSVELEDAKLKVAQFQKQCDEYLVIIVQQKREADEQQKVSGHVIIWRWRSSRSSATSTLSSSYNRNARLMNNRR